ncbi:MAG: 2-amino-4-hydroxy-6-hydroxymethyldihydropteridine diphosphokinase [Anaerolineaceae bacterium]|nr:2-amino-4-hydroxy-6-hydroxymethyldihydropteridine diphosphokinase [Anaerolineaceae bacterium]
MTHSVYLVLGTNIEPEKNTIKAIKQLTRHCIILKRSSTWETIAVGSKGPNFLNTALLIETELSAEQFKAEVISEIENQLGRIRTSDKNAPRTMDIDIVLYDEQLLDKNLWKKAFVAIPMAELIPQQKHPSMNLTLEEFIRQFEGKKLAVLHPLQVEELY